LRSLKRLLKRNLAKSEFRHFFNFIWSQAVEKSEGCFIPSEHIDRWCDELQDNTHTSKESARKHAKSEILHALGPWKFFKKKLSLELFYFSYKQDLAAYHVRKIKEAMLEITEFAGIEWLSPADSVIHCRWPGTKITLRIVPVGFKGAKRGPHPHGVICDDILKDPTQRKLNIEELGEMGRVFREEVLSMPKEGGFCHCWGTSQDPTDVFNENRTRKNFHCTKEPALYVKDGKHYSLWPGMFSLERLEQIKDEIKPKAFNKEYMCAPVRGEEGYFSHAEIEDIIDVDLQEIDPDDFKTQDELYGGFDIGKKRHPSHLALFVLRDGRLVQILSKWMDGWDYSDQIEYLNVLCDKLSPCCLKYDNTRSEFESYAEKGNLPECMEPVVFGARNKNEMAALLESRIRAKENKTPKPTIVLLKDERQKNQILSVDNDLHSPESPDGHGDSFWSCALACSAVDSGSGTYVN